VNNTVGALDGLRTALRQGCGEAIALGRNTYSCFDGLPEQRQALAVKPARNNDIHAGSGDRHHGKIDCRPGSNDPINMKTM